MRLRHRTLGTSVEPGQVVLDCPMLAYKLTAQQVHRSFPPTNSLKQFSKLSRLTLGLARFYSLRQKVRSAFGL